MLLAFRLCKVLGVAHPKYLPLTAEEFFDWEAYSYVEPWGYDMDNVRTASLQATVANFSGNSKRKLKIEDFLPKAPKKETVEDAVKRLFNFGR